ncbi:TauD/TfdA family dioxygenase [Virgisporangium aurantiacum]
MTAVITVPDGAGPDWLRAHREAVRSVVTRTGAVVVRGLAIVDDGSFAAACHAVTDTTVREREPFAPREPRPGAGIAHSSAAWPPDQPMCMHHEGSYGREVPGLMLFGCLVAPASGGAIALADGAAVLRDLPPTLVDRFAREGWRLIRNHNGFIGVGWQDAYGVTELDALADHCRAEDIELTLTPDGTVRTSRRRPAVVAHPETGEPVWFNQIAFLNEWTMEPAVREYLVAEFGPEGLPYTTTYGNGDPLDEATVALINDVYAAHTVREPLRAGDLSIVDNLRTAHSRDPYTGDREVVVAFAEPLVPVPAVPTAA